jgi:predicted nuclease with TOPRIM domain
VAETKDNLELLEAKLNKVVDLFKKTQAEKLALQNELERLKSDVRDDSHRAEQFEKELIFLRKEREEVRGRVEKLLKQIDGLTSSDSLA